MAKIKNVSSAAIPAEPVMEALERACALLKAGDLREAARWAAIAAGLGEAKILPETL